MLTEEEAQKVRLVMASPGWNDVVRPAIENRGRQAIKALVLPLAERAGEWKNASDDFLRAVIRDCEWMISIWQNEMAVAEHNRRLDELDRQNMDAGASGANPH